MPNPRISLDFLALSTPVQMPSNIQFFCVLEALRAPEGELLRAAAALLRH